MTTGFQIPAVSDAAEFPLVPEGLYLFRLKDMESAGLGKDWGDGREPKERVKWIFEIEEVISGDDESEEFVGEEFWDWTTLSMNKKATMYAWAIALLGREPAVGEEVGSADLIGKRARATVEHKEKAAGGHRHAIASLMRVPGKKKPARPAPVEEPDDEDFDEF